MPLLSYLFAQSNSHYSMATNGLIQGFVQVLRELATILTVTILLTPITCQGIGKSYIYIVLQGWRNEKKVGGLTLPLNDCTEAGVQGLHSEEFHDFTCSEMHILVQ